MAKVGLAPRQERSRVPAVDHEAVLSLLGAIKADLGVHTEQVTRTALAALPFLLILTDEEAKTEQAGKGRSFQQSLRFLWMVAFCCMDKGLIF